MKYGSQCEMCGKSRSDKVDKGEPTPEDDPGQDQGWEPGHTPALGLVLKFKA